MITARYLSVRDAAIYLGYGDGPRAVRALYQAVHEGKIPCTRIGRTLRFDTKELDRTLARAMQKVSSGEALQ